MDVQQATNRLAQYRPFDRDGLDARTALGDLVLASAMEAGGQIHSLADSREAIKVLWGLQVEIDELRSIIEGLVKTQRLEAHGPRYIVSDSAKAQLSLTKQESSALEATALDEWRKAVKRLDGSVSDSDLAILTEDLEAWLAQVIHRHGLESALILYPELPRSQEMFAKIEELGLAFLPPRSSRIEAVREQALLLFVRQPTASQRAVLANRMDTAYFLIVLSLDPQARRLVEDITAGQRVYLDTNVIYKVLNLSGPSEFLSARRLLELTTGLQYELAVTPWTVTELRKSLERARDYLIRRPIPPADLAELAASATTDQNFITAYWQRVRHSPTSVQDFYDFFYEIESHLEEHRIQVIDEGCTAVDRNTEAVNREALVLDSVAGNRFKAEPVLEHDVKHRLLVLRLRGSNSRRFSNAGYWFLTYDSALPRYDNAARMGKGELSFCASASSWFQAMRSFTPRTEDFDQTLSDLLASPYIRYRGRISFDVVQHAISRIDLFKGRTPELAAKVLLNTALLREVAKAEVESRDALIDDAVVAAAADIQRRLNEAEERADEEREARKRAARETNETEELLAQERGRVLRLEEQLVAERRDREAKHRLARAELEESRLEHERSMADLERRSGEQREELAASVTRLEERIERQDRLFGAWYTAGKIALLVLSASAMSILAIFLIASHRVEGIGYITALIFGLSIVIAVVFGLLFGFRRTIAVYSGAATLLGGLAGILQLVQTAIGDK